MKNNVMNLVRKDLRLLLHTSTVIFFILAPAMLFIPSYPRPIAYFYLIVSVMNMFTLALQYKDHEFTGLLPVTKKEAVKARVLSICIVELALLLVTVPFAFLAARMQSRSGIVNNAGMNINATLYAIVILGYGIANLIMIPGGFKKNFRVIVRGIIAMAVFMVLTLGLESFVSHVEPAGVDALFSGKDTPAVRLMFLNVTTLPAILRQLPILAASLAVYAGLNFIACRIACRNYEEAEI